MWHVDRRKACPKLTAGQAISTPRRVCGRVTDWVRAAQWRSLRQRPTARKAQLWYRPQKRRHLNANDFAKNWAFSGIVTQRAKTDCGNAANRNLVVRPSRHSGCPMAAALQSVKTLCAGAMWQGAGLRVLTGSGSQGGHCLGSIVQVFQVCLPYLPTCGFSGATLPHGPRQGV